MPQPSSTDAPLCLYTPTLHRGLAPATVPGSVLFLYPGLGHAPEGSCTPCGLPLSPSEASAALAELLQLGERLGPDILRADQARAGLASSAANNAGSATEYTHLSAAEKQALGRFAHGEHPATPASPQAPPDATTPSWSGDDAAVNAHKVLLLAWDLEQRLLELATLRGEVAAAAGPLAESLADPTLAGEHDEAREALAAVRKLLDAPGPDVKEPDWRLVLSATAAFLPEGAFLVTAHEGMRSALLESGMLHPLPEDVAQQLPSWPEEVKSACLWASGVPIWRMTGRARPPENAPWLMRTPEVLVCPAGRRA